MAPEAMSDNGESTGGLFSIRFVVGAFILSDRSNSQPLIGFERLRPKTTTREEATGTRGGPRQSIASA